MNHVYLQELQSGPSGVASSTHSMLGVSNTLYDFFVVKSQQRASHYIAPFDYVPATLCLVKSHFIALNLGLFS